MIFGTSNMELWRNLTFSGCSPRLKNVTTLPCEIHKKSSPTASCLGHLQMQLDKFSQQEILLFFTDQKLFTVVPLWTYKITLYTWRWQPKYMTYALAIFYAVGILMIYLGSHASPELTPAPVVEVKFRITGTEETGSLKWSIKTDDRRKVTKLRPQDWTGSFQQYTNMITTCRHTRKHAHEVTIYKYIRLPESACLNAVYTQQYRQKHRLYRITLSLVQAFLL